MKKAAAKYLAWFHSYSDVVNRNAIFPDSLPECFRQAFDPQDVCTCFVVFLLHSSSFSSNIVVLFTRRYFGVSEARSEM